jgi:hypothetical protein
MKFLYIFSDWVPFPRSEYGGLIVALASSDEECMDLLVKAGECYDKTFNHLMPDAVKNAHKFETTDRTESRIISLFRT